MRFSFHLRVHEAVLELADCDLTPWISLCPVWDLAHHNTARMRRLYHSVLVMRKALDISDFQVASLESLQQPYVGIFGCFAV